MVNNCKKKDIIVIYCGFNGGNKVFIHYNFDCRCCIKKTHPTYE